MRDVDGGSGDVQRGVGPFVVLLGARTLKCERAMDLSANVERAALNIDAVSWAIPWPYPALSQELVICK